MNLAGPEIKTVIFDIDGTLVDSVDLHAKHGGARSKTSANQCRLRMFVAKLVRARIS
jgi:phosphoglycolate phosphatase-like HAD superfamily hydrolase